MLWLLGSLSLRSLPQRPLRHGVVAVGDAVAGVVMDIMAAMGGDCAAAAGVMAALGVGAGAMAAVGGIRPMAMGPVGVILDIMGRAMAITVGELNFEHRSAKKDIILTM